MKANGIENERIRKSDNSLSIFECIQCVCCTRNAIAEIAISIEMFLMGEFATGYCCINISAWRIYVMELMFRTAISV